MTAMGYHAVTAVGHPLAARKGRVLEHRRVLYDVIGPGEHPCHWCERLVSWEKRWPHADGIVVDHLDGNRLNNDLANLVVSCRTCNTSVTIARGELVALRREVEELRAQLAAA